MTTGTWIDHPGFGCPVPANVTVEVARRDGGTAAGPAGDMQWTWAATAQADHQRAIDRAEALNEAQAIAATEVLDATRAPPPAPVAVPAPKTFNAAADVLRYRVDGKTVNWL